MQRADLEDGLLAAAVILLGQVDVWAPDVFSTNLVGPPWQISVCYAVAGLALAWRRRRPFGSFCVVVAALAVQALLVGASEGNGVLLPALVAAYSVAANATRRQAFVALGTIVALAVVREVRNPENVTVSATADAIAWDLVIVGGWLLGAYLRTRRLYVAELADRASRAELEREERAAAAAADERNRIAREMHDILAHSVTLMVVQAEAAEEMLDRDPDRARLPLRTIQGAGRTALVELRRTLGILRGQPSTSLAPQPGLGSVPALVAELEAAGLPVTVSVEGAGAALSPGLDLTAYRIVQEALTNALRHAGARSATLSIRYQPGAIDLEVSDDGDGHPSASVTGAGHGLVGMRERAALYGGELHAGPMGPRGYVVRARLPLGGAQ